MQTGNYIGALDFADCFRPKRIELSRCGGDNVEAPDQTKNL